MKTITVRKTDPQGRPHQSTCPGFLPFTLFGERFAVTENHDIFGGRYLATHLKTGAAIPGSGADTKAGAKGKGILVLKANGAEKLIAVIAAAKEKIAKAQKSAPPSA